MYPPLMRKRAEFTEAGSGLQSSFAPIGAYVN